VLLQKKSQIFFLFTVIIFFSCKGIGYSKGPCDELYLYSDNKKNDTNKVQIIGTGVFDTTANMLNGVIVDSLTNKPIVGAKVYIWNGHKNYSDSSDSSGNFKFFKNGFDGIWQMSIYYSDYKCLVIENINIGGFISLKIKLHKWL
jgi:hypothetical protein